MEPTEPEAWEDRTLSIDELASLVVRGAAILALMLLLPHLLFWGGPGWPDLHALPAWFARVLLYFLSGLAIYALSAVLHEGLHVLGMVVGAGVPWRAIRGGVRWREGVAYVHAAVPMTVRAYRGVLLLPSLVQGVLPAAAGLYLGNGWFTLYAYIMLVSAVGDFAVIRLLDGLAGDRLVRDHPKAIGCQVQK